jgi:hypothetical protein
VSALGLGTGLHPGVSFESYSAVEAMNVSKLKEMGRSPLHFRYWCEHQRDSKAFAMGRAAHAAVLEPERFDRDFVVWDQMTDGGRLRPRTGKDYEAFVRENEGKAIIKPDEHRFAIAVRSAVRAKPAAKKYMREGQPEVAMVWNDAATGALCKGRVDWITCVDGVDTVVGLKTTADLTARAFSQQAARLLYYLQWAYYFDGYSTITGKEPRMIEIVVEGEPPHDVVVYLIPPEVIELGREEYRGLLVKLGECEQSKRWPGRSDNELLFELPAYLMRDDEDEDVGGLELEGAERARLVASLNEGLV